MKKASVVSKDVALNDLEGFINQWVKKPAQKDELEGLYPDILDAIVDGYLVFDENQVPKYTLKNPIKNEAGDVSLAELNFVTRIKPTNLANIAKGIDVRVDPMNLQLRMVAHIIGQPIAYLDLFSRYDYDVISSVAAVFS
jgi:hypothetical protein